MFLCYTIDLFNLYRFYLCILYYCDFRCYLIEMKREVDNKRYDYYNQKKNKIHTNSTFIYIYNSPIQLVKIHDFQIEHSQFSKTHPKCMCSTKYLYFFSFRQQKLIMKSMCVQQKIICTDLYCEPSLSRSKVPRPLD